MIPADLDVAFVWAGLIAFAVLAYVILDGFDLGVGILFAATREEEERDVMTASIAPVWDGNETWLVLGGGGLFAAFPLAYAVVMPALYAPIVVMLLALVFRGVAFEFRWRSQRARGAWDAGFALGSLAAALAQGFALGALVQGVKVENRAFAGGAFDWLTPFSAATALALVVGYALLGATWLIWKTEGALQARMRRIARIAALATLAAIGLVSLATPFLDPAYAERWFGAPQVYYTILVPALAAGAAFALLRALARGRDALPFLAALALFALCFVGLGVSFYPNIVPPDLTIREAAAPRESLAFLLAGALILVPMVLAYTGYAYWTFRGKVDPAESYH
ncbi:MAG: cytochrome d ubiquinol oxidase subunit II [Rhizobiales bacterium]|nr:cytochrome d ubiquinol oxidase subunit II [Hyphomicrobiales bacterium]